MTNLQQRLINRLNLVRADLNEAIGRLTDEDIAWAPRKGMRTVGGQLQEIAATEHQILLMLKEGKKTKYEDVHKEFERGTVADYVTLLEQTRAETMALIASSTDDALESLAAMPSEWIESLSLDQVPQSEAIRSIAQHEWYHTGQLVSYLWSRGDDPYDWD